MMLMLLFFLLFDQIMFALSVRVFAKIFPIAYRKTAIQKTLARVDENDYGIRRDIL